MSAGPQPPPPPPRAPRRGKGAKPGGVAARWAEAKAEVQTMARPLAIVGVVCALVYCVFAFMTWGTVRSETSVRPIVLDPSTPVVPGTPYVNEETYTGIDITLGGLDGIFWLGADLVALGFCIAAFYGKGRVRGMIAVACLFGYVASSAALALQAYTSPPMNDGIFATVREVDVAPAWILAIAVTSIGAAVCGFGAARMWKTEKAIRSGQRSG